jgi:hypothetical protein
MDKLTSLLGFLAALSLATERITETIKGLPGLSRWLAVEKASGSTSEQFRKACVHFLAIAIGTSLAGLTHDQLSAALGLPYNGFWAYLLFGAMASGGSGLWNSALDIVREVNRQKQIVTEQLKSKTAVAD